MYTYLLSLLPNDSLFVNFDRYTPIDDLNRRTFALRAEKIADLPTYCSKPRGRVLDSEHFPQKRSKMPLTPLWATKRPRRPKTQDANIIHNQLRGPSSLLQCRLVHIFTIGVLRCPGNRVVHF
jgi:hypothetical protein